MELARLDSWRTARPAWRPKRYGLVSERAEAAGARIKRFRLARMEALPALEHLEPVLDTRSNRKA
jgi:hypothetical protein